MTIVTMLPRLFLGLIFFVFGLNYFLEFMAMPDLNEKATLFMGTLALTDYMLPLIKITEIVAGALLLAGLFVPLALVLLGPVVVNIFLFHFFMEPAGFGMSVLILVVFVIALYQYKEQYKHLLKS